MAILVYGLTLAPGLTWANHGGDGGELITAASTLGVPHPPGYPSYVLLGHLVASIPIGNPALRFNAWSALNAALMAGVVFNMLIDRDASLQQRQSPAYAPAVATALSLALAPAIWQQAIIAEVYTLNLLILSLFLWAVVRQRTFLSGLLIGLGITTHLTTLLLVPFWISRIRRQPPQSATLGLILGLLPWLTLPALSLTDSPVSWGEPTTLAGWWWMVSATLYAPNVAAVRLTDQLNAVVTNIASIMAQLGYIGWVVMLAATVNRKRPHRTQNRMMLLSAGLFAGYALSYDAENAAVYALPGLLILAPILMDGLRRFNSASLFLPLMLLTLNFDDVSLRMDHEVPVLGRAILTTAPPEAVLISPGDDTIFALWYLHHVEDVRPDITLVDANLLAFPWYRRRLHKRNPDLKGLEEDDLAAFITLNQAIRPVQSVGIRLSEPLSGPDGKGRPATLSIAEENL